MGKLILLRHGLSAWNEKNLFTGWVDIPLSEAGIRESIEAGQKIRELPVDVIFTSTLVRAHMTLAIAMLQHSSRKVPVFLHAGQGKLEEWGQIYSEETRYMTIPVTMAWELNERMYGELQGLNKAEMAKKFGEKQVHLWRRSFDVAPPGGESLEDDGQARVALFQKNDFAPLAKRGECADLRAWQFPTSDYYGSRSSLKRRGRKAGIGDRRAHRLSV